MAELNNFTNYNQTVSGITHDLKVLREYSRKLKLDGDASAIDEVLQRLANNEFRVAIVGEYNHGKSTLINALLAKDVLPMSILPTTATLNKIKYNMEKFVEIRYRDGREEKIDPDELKNYVTKLTKEGEAKAKTIKEAIVHYPIPYCQNGVTIIDTPGLNDDEAMTEVVMEVLPQIDAAIMVIMAQIPFSESERDFLESKIITSDLGRVMFVVTGIDQIDQDDVDRVLKHISDSIQEHVIAKAKRTYGEGSEEFEKYKKKIGKVKVHGLSAKNALKAKLENPVNVEMLKASCFSEFEKELECFLTEEKGAVTLSVPLNRIKTSSVELAKAAELRNSLLEMQKDEFNKKYAMATDGIEKIRRDMKGELDRITEGADKAIQELTPVIQSFWPSVERTAISAVDSFKINTLEEISDEQQQKKTTEELTNTVRNAISLELQNKAENVKTTIEAALGKEAERLSDFEANFYQATDKIQELFTSDLAKQKKSDAKKEAIAMGGNMILGGSPIFGVFQGYKQAGLKGALVGGGVGVAGALVAAGVLSAVLPIVGPVLGLITILGSGLFCHFTNKWALNKVFAKQQIESFKTSFKDAVKKDIERMKSESSINKSVREQVYEAFGALKEKMRSEMENKLSSMQNQLDQTKAEKVKNEADCENERTELVGMLDEIKAICKRSDEIGKQITEALSK